jgi:hypothetical protein
MSKDVIRTQESAEVNIAKTDNRLASERFEDARHSKVDSTAKPQAEFPTMYPVALAFDAAGKVGPNLVDAKWQPKNADQQFLVDSLKQVNSEIKESKLPVGVTCDAVAKVGDPKPVNDLMSKYGLDVKLKDGAPTDIFAGGIIQLQGSWQGKETTIASNTNGQEQEYPAVEIKGYGNKGGMPSGVEVYGMGEKQVAKLYDNGGLKVFATPYTEKLQGHQLLSQAQLLTPHEETESNHYAGITIPMVDMNKSASLDSIKGMEAPGVGVVSQAEMGVSLKINEKGFCAKTGVAVAVARGGGGGESFEIKDRFMIWATGDNCSQPVFAQIVDKQYWKNPGEIKELGQPPKNSESQGPKEFLQVVNAEGRVPFEALDYAEKYCKNKEDQQLISEFKSFIADVNSARKIWNSPITLEDFDGISKYYEKQKHPAGQIMSALAGAKVADTEKADQIIKTVENLKEKFPQLKKVIAEVLTSGQ